VCLAGIEGTGSYGAGLARPIASAGIRVVEVDRSADRTGAARVSPTRWMRSAPPGPPSPAGRQARRKDGTARSRRSGRVVTVHVAEHTITIDLGGDDVRTIRRTTTRAVRSIKAQQLRNARAAHVS
jgi:hypothetical protein